MKRTCPIILKQWFPNRDTVDPRPRYKRYASEMSNGVIFFIGYVIIIIIITSVVWHIEVYGN
jgi:hypothetical protein